MKKIAPTPSLADQVAIALGDEIVSGKYKIGDGLRSENDLSKAFGVSRTVTREAISRLKAEGLVESRQGAGYFVISCKRHSAFKIDSEVAHDINKVLPIVEFRLGFEVEAAALAAERANARDLRVIKDAFGRMQRALNLHDLEAGIQADFDFHMSICKATHNIYFPDLFQTFQGFLFETLKISRENSARRLNSEAPAQTEHEAILAAIMGKDPDAARLAAKRHIWNTRSRLESARTSSESVERPLVRNEVKPAVK